MTIGLDGAAVERALGGGRLGCPAVGCGAVLRPWRSARERLVRGSGWLLPRSGRNDGYPVIHCGLWSPGQHNPAVDHPEWTRTRVPKRPLG